MNSDNVAMNRLWKSVHTDACSRYGFIPGNGDGIGPSARGLALRRLLPLGRAVGRRLQPLLGPRQDRADRVDGHVEGRADLLVRPPFEVKQAHPLALLARQPPPQRPRPLLPLPATL